MQRYGRRVLCLVTGLLLTTAVMARASPPSAAHEVTDFGRTPFRTHYAAEEPQYPASPGVGPEWEVPLGLSRSQPLVIQRDFNGDGTPETRIYHLAGDQLWALNGDMRNVPPRQPNQSVEAYRQQLRQIGFILWSTPAMDLCAENGPRRRDDMLNGKCLLVGPNPLQRPYASSHAAYYEGATPAADVIYAGFGHPASVVALRASDGQILGGYIIDARGDRGIVGAPLVFDGDRVVINTTTGEGYILRNMARGPATIAHALLIGGRMSFSPVPLGPNGFILASDGRWTEQLGNHGYMMAYSLGNGPRDEFMPLWRAAVITPAGLPGEAAVDTGVLYMADKHGRLYALRHGTGELLWCRQYENRTLVNCYDRSGDPPGFINNGPGVDDERVYFVFRNSEGRAAGNGIVFALDKRTGQTVWQQSMPAWGNTAPVPMDCGKMTSI